MPPDAKQHADVHGSGNFVVQVVGENIDLTIGGTAALRLCEYAAFAAAPADPRSTQKAGYTTTGRGEVRLLSPYNLTSLPLQGRLDLLSRLNDWLAAPEAISVQVILGAGGRGKTRLAAELASEARATNWTAGFAPRDALDVFCSAGCRSRWERHTLVVIDYPAAKSVAFAAWLRALVRETDSSELGRPKLRILALERSGGEGTAWWREVFGGAGVEGHSVRELLASTAPITLGPLADRTQRHAVFAAAFQQASGAAAEGPSVDLDEALSRASLNGEPLFLAMFGLIAARYGMAAAQALGAEDLAITLAREELKRIERVWRAHGLPVEKYRPLHEHLAALAALCGGLDEPESHVAIAREAEALHLRIPGTESVRAALHSALSGKAGGIAAIQPDILAGATMVAAWQALGDLGASVVQRAVASPKAEAVKQAVIKAYRDFGSSPGPKSWIRILGNDRSIASDLERIISQMPPGMCQMASRSDLPDFNLDEWRTNTIRFVESHVKSS